MNILTVKTGDAAYNASNVTEREFWEYYLNLLNVRQPIKLNEREIQVMSIILAGNEHKSYFKGSEAKSIKDALRMRKSDLSKIKTSLITKKYIEDTGETRGDALPTRAIRTFQKHVKGQLAKGKMPVVNFMFTFNINEEENI